MLRYRAHAMPLNWTMTAWSSWATSTTKQDSVYQFFQKRFNQWWPQFLFTYSFSNWLAVSCFSFWKAFVKLPSLSVNGIFDDIRYDVISTYWCCSVQLNFLNILVRWSIRMIRAKNDETVSKFVKVIPRILWPLFPDMVHKWWTVGFHR